MRHSLTFGNSSRTGYLISPVSLNKWFPNAVLTADDLKNEFLNIYESLTGPLPTSLFDQTQESFLSDSPVLPIDGNYPIPTTHYDEHRQLKWVLRMLGHGTTDHWCQVPDIAPRFSVIEFVCDSTETYTAQVTAIKYKIEWAGDPQPEIILQTAAQEVLFSSPVIVFIENTSAAGSVTVGVRVGTSVENIIIPSMTTQSWGIGAGEIPKLLQAGALDVEHANKAETATTALQSLLSSAFMIDTVGKITSQEPAGTFFITIYNHSAIEFQKNGSPLFQVDMAPAVITIVNSTMYTHDLKWRTATGLQSLNGGNSFSCTNYFWDGTVGNAPSNILPWGYSLLSKDLIREKFDTVGVTTVNIDSVDFVVHEACKALHIRLTTDLPEEPRPTVNFDLMQPRFSTMVLVENMSHIGLLIQLTGAVGTETVLPGDCGALFCFGGVYPFGLGSSEIIYL